MPLVFATTGGIGSDLVSQPVLKPWRRCRWVCSEKHCSNKCSMELHNSISTSFHTADGFADRRHWKPSIVAILAHYQTKEEGGSKYPPATIHLMLCELQHIMWWNNRNYFRQKNVHCRQFHGMMETIYQNLYKEKIGMADWHNDITYEGWGKNPAESN